MKKNIKLLIGMVCSGFLFYACNKVDKMDNNSVFVDSAVPKNALDNYLVTNYMQPYNVEVLYKYVDKETNLAYRLVPAPYEASIRLTKLMLYAVMDPYSEVTGGRQFLRDNFPKIITYIGSVPVQPNGNITLGTAEAGTKVNLYNLLALNEERGSDSGFLNDYFF